MLKRWIKDYIKTNKMQIVIIMTVLLIGIIMGIIIFSFLPQQIKEEVIADVKETLNITKSGEYIKTNIIMNSIINNLVLIIVLGSFSLMLFGKYIIYFIMLLKALAISIYTAILFSIFGFGYGLIVTALLVLLVNIIYLPALVYLVACLLEVNYNIFNLRLKSVGLVKVFLKIIPVFIIMCSSGVIEQIATNVVLTLYSRL